MSRPLMQYGVGQLQEMFAKAKADLKVLKQLESELQYRQVPKAVALLTEVQRVICNATKSTGALGDATSAIPVAVPAIQQSGLFEHPETHTPRAGRSPMVTHPTPASKQSTSMTAAISVDDSYKLLNASPGSTWKSIEQTRQLLVQQAHPSRVATLSAVKRAQTEAEAARVNAAYLRLSILRCNS